MNISFIKNCYGCGVCATVCGHKIIDISLNSDGFYEPHITDISKCNNCGLCTDVCAYNHDNLSVNNKPIISYAAWSKDSIIRKKCTSGGVGFEIGRTLLNKEYKVCGVQYNTKTNRAEHYIATTIKELIPSIGSKYIQSYTVDGFKSINRKEKYLVVGTPCQIDSFRRYIRKFHCENNFILMDFFCHGVPSMLMWNKYTKWAESKVGKLTNVAWRSKFLGWHDMQNLSIENFKNINFIGWHNSYNLSIKGEKGFFNSPLLQGDMFYKLFLSDSCLGKACYEKCKYKHANSAADIRIGDLWGEKYKNDKLGVSAAIAFTEKGDKILNESYIELTQLPLETVTEGQLLNCPPKNKVYNEVMQKIKDSKSSIENISHLIPKTGKKKLIFMKLIHPLNTIKTIINKLFR